MKDDGTVERVRMAAEVGQEIELPEQTGLMRHFPVRRVAAAAVAFVAMAAGVLSQIQEYSYVSVDVDASVEYSLNRMDRVIRVKALNKQGEELAENVKKAGVTGSTLDKAVEKTANVLKEDGYVGSQEDGIIVSVSSKSDKKSEKLAQKVEDVLVNDEATAAVEQISMKERESAQESGLSAGRYAVTKGIIDQDSLDDAVIDISKSKTAGELLRIAEDMEVALDDEPQAEAVDPEMSTPETADVCEELHTDAEPENGAVGTDEAATGTEVPQEELEPSIAPLPETETEVVSDPASVTPVETLDDVKDGEPQTDAVTPETEAAQSDTAEDKELVEDTEEIEEALDIAP